MTAVAMMLSGSKNGMPRNETLKKPCDPWDPAPDAGRALAGGLLETCGTLPIPLITQRSQFESCPATTTARPGSSPRRAVFPCQRLVPALECRPRDLQWVLRPPSTA